MNRKTGYYMTDEKREKIKAFRQKMEDVFGIIEKEDMDYLSIRYDILYNDKLTAGEKLKAIRWYVDAVQARKGLASEIKLSNAEVLQIKRGAVFMANLGDGLGSEQEKIRPVIILQNNSYNETSPTIVIAPITTKNSKKTEMVAHIPIREKDHKVDSLIFLEQIRTIDKCRLLYYMFNAPDEVMPEIDKGITYTLGLNKSGNPA